MAPTLKGTVTHNSATDVSLRLQIEGLPEGALLHVDDSTDGSFAGMDPECKSCGNRVGYLHADVPSTMEAAYAAPFIPCVEIGSEVVMNDLYCLQCVIAGDIEVD